MKCSHGSNTRPDPLYTGAVRVFKGRTRVGVVGQTDFMTLEMIVQQLEYKGWGGRTDGFHDIRNDSTTVEIQGLGWWGRRGS